MRFPWNAVVFPAHSEVERETSFDFPIVLSEKREFILMKIAHALRSCFVVVEGVKLGRGVHIVQLRDSAQRSGKKTQQVSHSLVVSAGVRACQAWHVCRTDGCLGYRRGGQVTADHARLAENAAADEAGIPYFGVALPQLSSESEAVFSLGPTDGVAVCPERSRIPRVRLIAERQNSEGHGAIRVAGRAVYRSQLWEHGITVDVDAEVLFCVRCFLQRTDDLACRSPESDSRLIDEIW